MSQLLTITPQEYNTDNIKRALADRVMEAGGLDKHDVFEIVDLGDRYRCGLYVRDDNGKHYAENGEVVSRWVEVWL